MIRAFLFDLDGTLADTLRDLGDAVNGALARQGFPVREPERFRLMVGDGFAELIRRAAPADIDADALAGLRAEAAAAYAACALVHTRPFPGIPELLAGLALRGVPMAILTNKPDALARLVVAGLFPETSFALVRGEGQAFPRKPDPAAALDLARLLGHVPPDIAFLGDSAVDMATARNAGMLPVGVTWGYRDEAELLAGGAARLIREPGDALALLD